ncbi:MAG: hypothetical protein EBZ47_04715 [Chlamydiae bacterium]|nr:hypothetical protein [Chlamydiota bacterium]
MTASNFLILPSVTIERSTEGQLPLSSPPYSRSFGRRWCCLSRQEIVVGIIGSIIGLAVSIFYQQWLYCTSFLCSASMSACGVFVLDRQDQIAAHLQAEKKFKKIKMKLENKIHLLTYANSHQIREHSDLVDKSLKGNSSFSSLMDTSHWVLECLSEAVVGISLDEFEYNA